MESRQERLFWGYKILFLDVMFPNNLKRIIYVDSDDVIRSDYYNLMTIDMKVLPMHSLLSAKIDQKWKNIVSGMTAIGETS